MKVNSIPVEGAAEGEDKRFREALQRLDAFRIEFTGPYATSKGYVIAIDRRLLTAPELVNLFDGHPLETMISRDTVIERIRKFPREE